MAPLLVTALIGLGVKIAGDMLFAGVKQATADTAAPRASFASMLDRARGRGVADAKLMGPAPNAALAERSQLLALQGAAAGPSTTPPHATESYRRLQPEAI
ncbi:MAG TPA: hypothetical protein VEA38_12830 [Terriglobales bacterium]|nr:hypothetical protein [Terriglobales bacterium]